MQAAKILAKLNIKKSSNPGKEDDGNVRKNDGNDTSTSAGTQYVKNSPVSCHCIPDVEGRKENSLGRRSSYTANENGQKISDYIEDGFALGYRDGRSRQDDLYARPGSQRVANLEAEVANSKLTELEDDMQEKPDGKHQGSWGSSGTQGSSPRKGDYEPYPIVNCEIHWEDLHIGEEIGQGMSEEIFFLFFVSMLDPNLRLAFPCKMIYNKKLGL